MTAAGQQSIADRLTLNGDPADDVGTYRCNYVDKYGDERQRTFVVVVAAQTTSNNHHMMAIIISVSIVAAITVVAVGLLLFFHNAVRI